MLEKVERVLVFGGHPGDEIVGAGGTIAKLMKQKKRVKVVIYTSGAGGADSAAEAPQIGEIRTAETKRVENFLGCEYELFGMTEITSLRDAVKKALKVIREFKPDVIFTMYPNDKHQLHRGVAKSSIEACWHSSCPVYGELGPQWTVSQLYCYEVPESIGFYPTHLVDITDTIQDKLDAYDIYQSLKHWTLLKNFVESLAKVRGYLVDVDYAEGFVKPNLQHSLIF